MYSFYYVEVCFFYSCFLEGFCLKSMLNFAKLCLYYDFSGGLDGKASAYNAGDPASIPGSEDPLKKEIATHSNTLASKIPWTEECDRLQSMGWQRVGHD